MSLDTLFKYKPIILPPDKNFIRKIDVEKYINSEEVYDYQVQPGDEIIFSSNLKILRADVIEKLGVLEINNLRESYLEIKP